MKILTLVLLILPLFAASPEASNVLVIVNDATVPEAGTGTVGASQFVANHYIAARGIPAANVVHINSKGCCSFADGTSPALYNNFHVSPDQFTSDIAAPIKAYLESHNLKQQIKYIVPTYGVPTHIGQLPPWEQLSVDSFLAQMYLAGMTPFTFSSVYSAIDTSKPAHWSNAAAATPVYLVTRLDGPSALIAASLVDKAIAAEKGIAKNSGIGYFDFQGTSNPTGPTDQTMLNAYNFCVSAGMTCVLNTQQITGQRIQSAPNALWAWGWYGEPAGAGYSFAPGAVGAQLISDSAYTIRGATATGPWVPLWLSAGITATWGTTGEPFAQNYATGSNLLNHLWNGYSFGESAYISNPVLGWMMIFVGDPLYTPLFAAAALPPLSIAPASVNLSPGQSAQFTASGAGADAITWSIAANAGSVSRSGLFAAPTVMSELVTATSVADPSKSASATVTYSLAAPASSPIATAGTFAPIRVNAGATTTYTDTLGQTWLPDTGFNSACNGLVNAYPNAVIGGSTTAPEVYRTNHYGDCTFTAAVPNGAYTVNLMFAEIALNGPGRSFNVAINGQRVLSAFDIWQAAGGADLPVVKSFPVTVSSGRIAIQLSIENWGAIISGIEIVAQ